MHYLSMNEEEVVRKKLGEVIRKYRKANNLSQEELADFSNLHRTYISEVERGLKTVSLYSLMRISKALKKPVSFLLREVE